MKELHYFDYDIHYLGPHKNLFNTENITGNCSEIRGNARNLTGDVSNLTGDVTRLSGDISGLSGDATGVYLYMSAYAYLGDITGGAFKDLPIIAEID
jgi:hypothetical protein